MSEFPSDVCPVCEAEDYLADGKDYCWCCGHQGSDYEYHPTVDPDEYMLDSELECQKIDMGVYDDDGESFFNEFAR